MGNAHTKPYPKLRNKKQVHWKAADRPSPPGQPTLLFDTENTPDLVSIRWSHPLQDGGSPISGYLVEHRRVGSPHWVRATPLPVLFPEITLSGLEPGWRYQFRVSSENAVGYSNPSEASDPITVTLHRSAVAAPKITQDVKDTVAFENDKCEFVAHFLGQPPPKVCWFKDGFEIFSSRRIRIFTEHDRSVLTIHQTSLSDEGEIKCTATNRAGHVSSKARLTVEAPPNIRLPRQYEDGLLFEIGEVIRLKVSVVGRPTPLVFWSHNGETIQNKDRYEIEFMDKSSSLKIAQAERSDRGEYQIKAVNKLGEDISSFLVTVTDKPSAPSRARVVMALGRSVTLSWETPSDDGGCKIGNYIVEYYRLGWNVWLKAATSRQLSTILGDLIEGSEYKFRVKAESPYGVSEPSEESEVIFIPDPKRGLTNPPKRGRTPPTDFLEKIGSPVATRRKNKPRSQSSSRVEQQSMVSGINANISSAGVPQRPKRTKTKSQPQTPEPSPLAQRKDPVFGTNRRFFDRASIAREMAYGSPEYKVKRESELHQRERLSSMSDARSDVSKSPSPDRKGKHEDHAVYKLKYKDKPKVELQPVIIEPKKTPSPEREKKKLIRDYSATVSGSSEFMLVLYSDDNEREQSDMFNFDENSIPPPLSLSAPELGVEQPAFPPLKNSASSTDLLHERAMMRFYQAAEAEEAELEKKRKASGNRKLSLDIPKIQINSKDNENIVGLDRKHSLRRKLSAGGLSQQHVLWAQRRQSLKNSTELKNEALPRNIKKCPVYADMKHEPKNRTNNKKKVQTQDSFERRPVTIAEEQQWMADYEESASESETESDSEYERFKCEVTKSRKVQCDEGFEDEEETTYHPRALKNEPFEILTKPKKIPDPNFVPKPILKKTDSPSVSPSVSPTVSPPTSPTKTFRAHSPRPDLILQRNRSKSLATPVLAPLISNSSGDDDAAELTKPRDRSMSLQTDKSLLGKKIEVLKIKKKTPSMTFPSISAVAEITGLTAASIVIPERLLEKKKDAEESKVVADHYDHIVKSMGQRRKSNPHIYLDRDSLKKAAESLETPQEEEMSHKEQTPSKENLSNDSGYQSVSGFRRSSFTDHYDDRSMFKSPVRTPFTMSPGELTIGSKTSLENISRKTNVESRVSVDYNRSGSDFSQQTTDPQTIKDSLSGDKHDRVNQPSSRSSKTLESHTRTPRKTLPSPMGQRSVGRSKSPTKRGSSVSRRPSAASPARPENWSSLRTGEDSKNRRKTSPSPIRKNLSSARRSSRSPSPIPFSKRKPLLKEIMTQTSVGIESVSIDSYSRTSTPIYERYRQNVLMAKAEVQVRGAVDYLTDLAMFVVACWLYLFKNELLAIPVLLVMVYRQLKEEVKRRIPAWVERRFGKKKTE